MYGQLTMHGVTKEIAIPFEMAGKVDNPWGQGNTVVAFDGETKISRKAFGMTWNKIIEAGGLAVGDEVKIEIHIEAVKKK
jgi:polyisoprenoid-binding protein YceI